MDYLKGFTFGFNAKRGDLKKESARVSVKKLIDNTGSTSIVIPITAMQTGVNTTDIDFQSIYTYSREEYIDFSKYVNSLGATVIVKAMVNCKDNNWRGLINFFDIDVPCEKKWSDWFTEYTKFTNYCAEIAEEIKSPLYCIGCEMVCADKRSTEWRALIKEARKYYDGKITYNCDKYQEGNIDWWDAVDVISSSGYYPINNISSELSRIETIVSKYNKDFIFMECGCPSREGSEYIPNDWTFQGKCNVNSQLNWITEYIKQCELKKWVKGIVWWAWDIELYDIDQYMDNDGYQVYGKPSEQEILKYYSKK